MNFRIRGTSPTALSFAGCCLAQALTLLVKQRLQYKYSQTTKNSERQWLSLSPFNMARCCQSLGLYQSPYVEHEQRRGRSSQIFPPACPSVWFCF